MVAAVGAYLERRHAAELGGPTTSVSSSMPRALRSFEQRRGRLVENRRVDVVLLLERLVAVPVADALAHRVGAVEELHEPHAPLEQPPGQQAVAGEAGLALCSASSVP